MNRFSVLKQVILGLHSTVGEFRAALEQGGNWISSYTGQVLMQTPLATERTTVALIRATGRELDLVRNYTFTQLLAAAARHNLGKLPPESGPALRESYTDQPQDEVVWICMDPTAVSGGDPGVWIVGRDGVGRWLSAYCMYPVGGWDPEAVWVFGVVPSSR